MILYIPGIVGKSVGLPDVHYGYSFINSSSVARMITLDIVLLINDPL